jgi:hypothetical protein
MLARIIFLVLMAATAGPQEAQSGVWIGTWRLNAAKSATVPDRYKRVITKIEPWENGVRVEYDMVGVRGGVNHLEWTGKFDGKDYPVEGADYIITNAYSVIDDHHYQIVVKVEGRLSANAKVEVSPDGKTLTTVTTERNGRGQNISTTSVYERIG